MRPSPVGVSHAELSGRYCAVGGNDVVARWGVRTLGRFLRELTFGHARQLESLLRPVYGHAKQSASYGHTNIAGKQVLRKGLFP
jgi:hypothetical protein